MKIFRKHKLSIRIDPTSARCIVRNLINMHKFTWFTHVDLDLNPNQIKFIQRLYDGILIDPREKIAIKIFMVQYSKFHQVFDLDVAVKRRRETIYDYESNDSTLSSGSV